MSHKRARSYRVDEAIMTNTQTEANFWLTPEREQDRDRAHKLKLTVEQIDHLMVRLQRARDSMTNEENWEYLSHKLGR